MTTGEVVAQFERSKVELREATRTLERMADASERRAAEALAAVASPPLPPPPPPAPPAAPDPGPWPHGTPPHLRAAFDARSVALALERQARLRERREQHQRQMQERAFRGWEPPKSPPVYRRS
jgi:hypothetical protein